MLSIYKTVQHSLQKKNKKIIMGFVTLCDTMIHPLYVKISTKEIKPIIKAFMPNLPTLISIFLM